MQNLKKGPPYNRLCNIFFVEVGGTSCMVHTIMQSVCATWSYKSQPDISERSLPPLHFTYDTASQEIKYAVLWKLQLDISQFLAKMNEA